MKKILAVILALTLALSMGTVALAASYTHSILIPTPNSNLYIYKDKAMRSAEYTPGNTFYIPVTNDIDLDGDVYNNNLPNIKSVSALKDYRINYRVNEGRKFVSSLKFVTKSDGNATQAWIAIGTASSYASGSMDVDIEFTVYGKNGAVVNGLDSADFNVSFTLENGVTEASGYTTINSDRPLVNFEGVDDSDPIQLYFENDVEFHVGVKGQKDLYLKYSDDPMGTKYDLDEKYPSADLEYHLWDGTNKTFRRTGKLYIPAASISNGKAPHLYQISSSGALTQVKAKYTDETFIIDTATLNNYVVSDRALSASGSTSSSTTETPSETPSESPSTGSGSTTTGSEIANQVAQKIRNAKANGTARPSVDLAVQNEESISAKDLQTIVSAAQNAGGTVRILADTVSGGSMTGRLYIQPSSSSVVKHDIKYGVYTDADTSTETMFEKYYNNDVSVIRLGQNATFGFPVSIAAKADLSGLNTKTLKFYSYDRSTGKFFLIPSPAYWLDTAGFLHFNTTLAGDIVITDKPLKAK